MTVNKNYQNPDLTDDDYERVYKLKSAADEVQRYYQEISINYKAPDSEEHVEMLNGMLSMVSAILELSPNQRKIAAYFAANVLYVIYENLKAESMEKSSWLNLNVISGMFVREDIFDLLRNEDTQFIGLAMGVFVPDNNPDPAVIAAVLQGATGDIVGSDVEYNLLDNIEDLFDFDEVEPIQIGKGIVGYICEVNYQLASLQIGDIL